ncbi:MAG: ABC transporter permease [Desulfitibacter sp. BRH_c19]|nr:MAG: ABC transporter permease [Desulfitibacter sp. BRH_c19]
MLKSAWNKLDYYSLVRVTVAVLCAFALASCIIFIFSNTPVAAISKLLLGPLQSKRNFFVVIQTMIPLIFTGLAINIMFKSGLFNIAADGSFYIGAVIAAFIGIKIQLPNIIHQIVIIFVAALIGGLITSIPAIIREKTGAHEFVTSMMLNAVFFFMGIYVVNTYLLDKTAGYASVRFNETASLGNMINGTQIHYGFLIMIIVLIVIYVVIEKTKLGYEIKLVGSNKNFARYSGIKIGRTIIVSQLIGGIVAGIGGAVEMIGMYKRFTWNSPVTYVWDGILIYLLASSKPIFIPLAAFFISYIRVGADIMSRATHVDNSIVAIIQAVIILLVSAERFMYNLKKKKEEKQALLAQQSIEMTAN